MLRLACLSTFAITAALSLTACDKANIAIGGSGGTSSGGTSSGGSSSGGTSSGGTSSGGGTTAAGGSSSGGTATGGTGGIGTGGTGGSSTGGTGGGTTSSSTTSTTTGGKVSCTSVGGMCEPVTPGACLGGVVGDSSLYTCGGGVGVLCCLPKVCTPGQDQTCNENPAMQSFAGHCNADGTCTCSAGFSKKASGKCG